MKADSKRYKWRREDYRENTKGLLMVNTGDGKGKTTAAIGVIVRAAGRGLKCCMIQFMKSKTDRYGEHESLETLGVEVHTMGDGFTWDTRTTRRTSRPRKKRGRCASRKCEAANTSCLFLTRSFTCLITNFSMSAKFSMRSKPSAKNSRTCISS